MNTINTTKELLGVVGHPVEHSVSPQMHEAAFGHLGLNAQYIRVLVPPEEAEELVESMQRFNVRQFAVTIPHKKIALRVANTASDIAKTIGSANTLTRTVHGTIRADNTDWIGVRDALQATGKDWTGKKALLLSAGGAARGAAYALQQMGMDVGIRNLSSEPAQSIIREFGMHMDEGTEEYDLVINATSVGLHDASVPENVTKTPIAKEELRAGMTVFDTVMNPLETRLLREAREQGCDTIDGLQMLVHQGIEQLRIWTAEARPNVRKKIDNRKDELAVVMREAAESALRHRSNRR